MRKFSITLLSVATALAMAHAAMADPIVNGTFSTPTTSSVSWGTLAPGGGSVGGPGTVTWGSDQYGYDPTNINGWTFSPLTPGVSGSGIADQGSAFGFTPPPSGASQVAFLQVNDASISQTVQGLTVGDEYSLLFNLEGRPSTGGAATTVTLGGDTLLLGVAPATGAWTSYDLQFTATSASELLTFFTTDPSGNDVATAIDDVVITPEPSSLLLLGTGLLGLAFLAFRKAKSSGLVLHS